MNIEEMKENGTIDYFLTLKKWIYHFLDKNYPLSNDDLRSLVQDTPSENVKKRQETYEIMTQALE